LIDPACSIGDGWADIAMMRLFGGIPRACFDAYAAAVDDHEQVETRIAVYQLYHLLNHVNLFGRGYVGQAMGVARRLH
ncbi:MAG: fructosamine kinase family protein, partial [Planctomycetota bacterium]